MKTLGNWYTYPSSTQLSIPFQCNSFLTFCSSSAVTGFSKGFFLSLVIIGVEVEGKTSSACCGDRWLTSSSSTVCCSKPAVEALPVQLDGPFSEMSHVWKREPINQIKILKESVLIFKWVFLYNTLNYFWDKKQIKLIHLWTLWWAIVYENNIKGIHFGKGK